MGINGGYFPLLRSSAMIRKMLISYDKIREKEVINFSQSFEIFNFCIFNLENLIFLNSGQIKTFYI